MSVFIREAQKKGIARIEDENQYFNVLKSFDALPENLPTITTPSNSLPAQMLTTLMTETVEVFTRKRSAEEVMGTLTKTIAWEMETGTFPIIERTGETSDYSDFGKPRYVGVNANFANLRQYRFTTGIIVGDLRSAQYAQAKIDLPKQENTAAAETLAIKMNDIAFNGHVVSGAMQVYGILNHPDLLPYETIANEWTEQTTYEQIKADIGKLLSKLQTQSGSNVDITRDKIKIALPPTKLNILNMATTDLGYPAVEAIKRAFPTVEFTSAPELIGAYTGNKDVVIIQAINKVGGTEKTGILGYSELGRLSRVVLEHNGYTQEMMAGTTGYTPFKPTFIVRAQGI